MLPWRAGRTWRCDTAAQHHPARRQVAGRGSRRRSPRGIAATPPLRRDSLPAPGHRPACWPPALRSSLRTFCSLPGNGMRTSGLPETAIGLAEPGRWRGWQPDPAAPGRSRPMPHPKIAHRTSNIRRSTFIDPADRDGPMQVPPSVLDCGRYSQPAPAAISQRIDTRQQVHEVDFARAGLVATRIVGDLHVPDRRQQPFHRTHQVTLHHLHMIDVVLQVQVGSLGLAHALQRERVPSSR